MNVFSKTLKEIISSLKAYVDKFKCLVAKDVIQAQANGEDRADGVEDSPHKTGFLLIPMWLLGQKIPDWLNYDSHFAKEDMILDGVLHKKGDIIRHPCTKYSSSADQIFPLLLGLLLYGHEKANPFYRKLRNKLFKCHNGNYISPMYIATLIRAYTPETTFGQVMYHVTFPFKWILLNILDLLLVFYLMVVMGPIGRWIYWTYSKVMKLLGKIPGDNPFGVKTEWHGKEVYMGSETLRIQPLLAVETGSKIYPTLPIKIAKWLYYKQYGDVKGIFQRYFEMVEHKGDPLYSPPLHDLIKFYLDLSKK